MCFSAAASFGGSVVLAGVGGASLKASSPKTRLFALIPLLFAVQQAIEGFQWLALNSAQGEACLPLGYGFLFFAFLLWPVYMPLAFMQMETNPQRRRRMRVWFVLGVTISAILLWYMLTTPLEISHTIGHIVYRIGAPSPMAISLLYTLAACIPGLISSYFFVRLFAALTFLTSVASGIIYTEAYVSVWCFFAAILSVIIVFGVKEREQVR